MDGFATGGVAAGFRAASNLLTNDLSLAGAAWSRRIDPTADVGDASVVRLRANHGTCYINSGAGETYPVQGTTPYLYGLLPDTRKGRRSTPWQPISSRWCTRTQLRFGLLHRECNEFDNGYVHAAGNTELHVADEHQYTAGGQRCGCRTYGGRSGLVHIWHV